MATSKTAATTTAPATVKKVGWWGTITGSVKTIVPDGTKAVSTGLKVVNVNLDSALNLSAAGNLSTKTTFLEAIGDYRETLAELNISEADAEKMLAEYKL